MSEYTASIKWTRLKDEKFTDKKYSRGHTWEFDGGVMVPASSSPHAVPLPYSIEENVDPEEAFVASISSCHMLTFLFVAAKRNFVVDEYVDNASGSMGKNSEGKYAITTITLRPKIIFSGDLQPTQKQLEDMHHQAHEDCFIANSVKTKITTEVNS